jgi:hypothetical protein
MANDSLDRFRETHTTEQQQFIVDAFVETGEIPTGEAFGIEQIEADVVEAAFTMHIERNVLAPAGLAMEDWVDSMDPADFPAFRKAVAQGNWDVLRDHAIRVREALDALPETD